MCDSRQWENQPFLNVNTLNAPKFKAPAFIGIVVTYIVFCFLKK